MTVRVFYHVRTAAGQAWEAGVRDQLAKIHWSGLYDAAEAVHVGVCGPDAEACLAVLREYGAKVAAAAVEGSGSETFALMMRRLVRPEDRLVYLHNGSGGTDNDDLRQRQYVEHTMVKKWRRCVDLLAIADVVGTGYTAQHGFSGNFWWCTGAHYLRLPPQDPAAPGVHVLRGVTCNSVAFPAAADRPLAEYCDLKEPVRRVP